MSKDEKRVGKLKPARNSAESLSAGGFWPTAKAWWDDATRDSGSVKRNLAMLSGVTLAAMLCIWSIGGAMALIVGSVHAWSLAGAGVGVASVLAGVGTRLHRKRRPSGPAG
jgi:hypothetical protein